MDSSRNKIRSCQIDEHIISDIFPKISKASSEINENKYFDIKKPEKMPVEHAGKNNKNKITQLEWFGNLSVEERKLAVSTIFPIKKEGILHDLTINISECQNSSHDLESQEYGDRFFNSNSDYLSHSRFGSRSQYASINTMSVQRGFISRHITFTDTFAPEDTLTVEDELVKNIEVFSDILESNKAKVNDFMAKSGRAR